MSFALNPKAANVPCERRKYQRYPAGADALVFSSGISKKAEILDIATGGVLLNTGGRLPVGRRIQLVIDWPALLNDGFALRLVVEGRVLRSHRTGTAIKIVRYDFRTVPRG